MKIPGPTNAYEPRTLIRQVRSFGLALRRIVHRPSALLAQRPVRCGVIASMTCFAILWSLFCIWVHYCYEGYYYGPFLISEHFHMPRQAAESGIKPVVSHEDGFGWDGQFYYHQSNDLFLRKDTFGDHDFANFRNEVSYRYQRIGMPMLANLAATLLGTDITPPGLYHLIQILVVALGFGCLAGWLTAWGQNPWWAVVWAGSLGGIYSLAHGLPDAPCDALFVVSFLALLRRKLWIYVPAASLLVLGREGYAIFPAMVFLGTALNLILWQQERWVVRSMLTALPGGVLLGWSAFLAWKLGTPILGGSRSVEWGLLLDYPFVAFHDTLLVAWDKGDPLEVKLKLLSVLTLLTVGGGLLRTAWKLPVALTAFPYLVLSAMTGSIVWSGWIGHQKAMGTILLLGILMLPWHRGWFLRVVLLLNFGVAVEGFFLHKIWSPPYHSPRQVELSPSPGPPGPNNPPFDDFRSKVAVEDLDYKNKYEGIWKRFHRQASLFGARLSNQSDITWQVNPYLGQPMFVGLGWFVNDAEGQKLREGRVPLPHPVRPAQSANINFMVTPPLPPGKYTLVCSLIQEYRNWAYLIDPSYGEYHEFVVE